MRKIPFTTGPFAAEDSQYSELKVCRSGGGFYIGRDFTDSDGYPMPGSRESAYFSLREEAETAMQTGFQWRAASENLLLYTNPPTIGLVSIPPTNPDTET